MSSTDDRIREAFDAVTLPPDVKASALAAIERARKQEEDAAREAKAPSVSPGAADVPTCPTPIVDAPAMRTRRKRRWRAPLAVAACLVAAAIGIGGYGAYSAYATETAIVGIEINPSIELGVNRFDTVIAARAYNDEGQAVLDSVSVVGDSCTDAIEEIASSDIVVQLAQNDQVMDVSVVCGNDAQATSLLEAGDDALAACQMEGSCHRASSEEHEEAESAGMGVGRYAAALELMQVDPSVTLDECRSMTMRELLDAILEIDPDNDFANGRAGYHHSEEDESEHDGTEYGYGQGQGSGQGSGQGNGAAGSQGQGAGPMGHDADEQGHRYGHE